MDKDGDGLVTKRECLSAIMQSTQIRRLADQLPILKSITRPGKWRTAFTSMDVDEFGYVSWQELRHFFVVEVFGVKERINEDEELEELSPVKSITAALASGSPMSITRHEVEAEYMERRRKVHAWKRQKKLGRSLGKEGNREGNVVGIQGADGSQGEAFTKIEEVEGGEEEEMIDEQTWEFI